MSAGVPSACPLSTRQYQAIALLAEGLTYKAIGRRMGCTESSVRTHLHNAYSRLRVHRAAPAVKIAIEAGWLDVVDDGWEDSRVTAAQSLYLAAFDKLLLARTPDAVSRARGDMDHMLTAMCIERGVPQPRGQRASHGLKRELPGIVLPNVEA